MNIPLVSVVMSVYNSEKYLAEAIESILNQTYTDFEFIIINDGSKDKSLEIIQSYMTKDKRIILINRKNKGLPYSLNEGIAEAKGKYIARMDADDVSLPFRLEDQVKFMEENQNIGICGAWTEAFNNNGYSRVNKYEKDDVILKTNLIFSNPFAHPTVIIRKSVLIQNNLFYDENFKNSQDYDMWARASIHTEFSNLQKVLLRYRLNNTSISHLTKDNDKKKFEISSSVHSFLIKRLNINISLADKHLHYNVANTYRIKKNNINLFSLFKYFKKLIDSNNEKCVFNSKLFIELLSYKFFIASITGLRKNFFSSLKSLQYPLFWKGMLAFIRRKF